MKIARLAFAAALLAALAAPSIASPAPTVTAPTVTAIPLKAPAPAWYTPELHAKVLAAGAAGVPIPEEAAVPMSSLAFLGIRPGQFIIVGDSLCSSNFVFRNGANYAIGTAGHCGGVGAPVTMLTAPRGLVNIGNVTKSVNGGIGNDFALISIKPELNNYVSPSMAIWGGPKGAHTSGIPLLVRHVGWGAGIGAGGTPRVGIGLTWNPANRWTFIGTIAPIDSGSGAIDPQWKAVGNITHLLVGPVPNLHTAAGTSMTRISAIAGLPLATCGPSPWPLYGCPGL